MCCGQKRTQLRNSQTQTQSQSDHPYLPADVQWQLIRTQQSPGPAVSVVSPQPRVNPQVRGVAIPSAAPLAPAQGSDLHSSVVIRYLETSPARVLGQITGRSYEFSGMHRTQTVDARDASSLLNTRFFRRA
jgi:hypothetical protein